MSVQQGRYRMKSLFACFFSLFLRSKITAFYNDNIEIENEPRKNTHTHTLNYTAETRKQSVIQQTSKIARY